MAVPTDAVGFLPNDEQDLAVRLQAHEPVDDVDPGLLQAAGPFDVRLFVEAAANNWRHTALCGVLPSPLRD